MSPVKCQAYLRYAGMYRRKEARVRYAKAPVPEDMQYLKIYLILRIYIGRVLTLKPIENKRVSEAS